MRLLALCTSLAACYSPHPQSGAPCAPGNTCPDPLVCVATAGGAVCAPPGTKFPDAAVTPDTPPADAPADASVDAFIHPMLVQSASNYAEGVTTLDITFTAEPASGNLLVMVGATPSGLLDSVTGGGATWTRATASTANANIEIWYGTKTGTGSTVTITRAAIASAFFASITEWSGTTGVLDNAISTSGLTSPASAGSLLTTHPHSLIIFAVSDTAPNTFGTPAPGTWVSLPDVGPTPTYVEHVWHRQVTNTSTFSPAVSETGNHWDAAVAAFVAP